MRGFGIWSRSLPQPPAVGKFWTGITEQENLYKVGGSLKRLKQAEALLWEGQVEAVKTLFTNCRLKQAKNFCAYLEQHRQRIVNYSYYQSEQLCSVGSGAVESAMRADWLKDKNLRGAVEGRKCQSGAFCTLCLPQWSAGSLTVSTPDSRRVDKPVVGCDRVFDSCCLFSKKHSW